MRQHTDVYALAHIRTPGSYNRFRRGGGNSGGFGRLGLLADLAQPAVNLGALDAEQARGL